MQYKIYFNSKPLYLVSEITPDIEEYLHHEETVFIDELNVHTVKAMIHEMEQDKILRGVFLHEDLEALLHAFKKKLSLIVAAGGLVKSDKGEVLLIFRKGKWDLPKGKLDDKEDLEKAAVREVEEETGAKDVKLKEKIQVSYHTYHQDGKHYLKETHWFKMKTKHQDLSPQTDEDIEQCIWVKPGDLQPYLEHTHALIADILRSEFKDLN